jgi:putative (di)nucleoside polyphosphate hydrolase
MIDTNGFRLNVGIILANPSGQLFWGKRAGKRDAWQFPQGGMQHNETPEKAMYRELYEEIGLAKNDVQILAQTQQWFHYYLPEHLLRHHQKPLCIGQKQKWFLLRLLSDEQTIDFNHTAKPEFTAWCWIDYWTPPKQVIAFKQEVYKNALEELQPFLS